MVNLNLRLPPDLHAALTEAARRENRSLNRQIVYLLAAAAVPVIATGNKQSADSETAPRGRRARRAQHADQPADED